jgi:hypothetical protein
VLGYPRRPYGSDLLVLLSAATLFNLAGSTFASQSRYDTTSGLSLPFKLPWRSVKALVRALLDSLTASLLTPEGSALQRSMLALPFAPLDASAQASIAALVASIERDTTSRLLSRAEGEAAAAPRPFGHRRRHRSHLHRCRHRSLHRSLHRFRKLLPCRLRALRSTRPSPWPATLAASSKPASAGRRRRRREERWMLA